MKKDLSKKYLRQLILEIIAIPFPDENVASTPDSAVLADEFGFDHGDYLDIILELKLQYNLVVKNPDFREFTTLGETVNYIHSKLTS